MCPSILTGNTQIRGAYGLKVTHEKMISALEDQLFAMKKALQTAKEENVKTQRQLTKDVAKWKQKALQLEEELEKMKGASLQKFNSQELLLSLQEKESQVSWERRRPTITNNRHFSRSYSCLSR